MISEIVTYPVSWSDCYQLFFVMSQQTTLTAFFQTRRRAPDLQAAKRRKILVEDTLQDVQVPEPYSFLMLAGVLWGRIFEGTVSRDGFGFRWHAWSVLGLHRGREKYTFCVMNSLKPLKNLKNVPVLLGLKLTTIHAIKSQIHLVRHSPQQIKCSNPLIDTMPVNNLTCPSPYLVVLLTIRYPGMPFFVISGSEDSLMLKTG